MRVTQHEMDAHHGRIVEGAARLMRERGVRSTSVADAMNEAGLTHGGFYRHFRNKDDLVAEALRSAFDDFARPFELRLETDAPRAVADEYKALYLSEEHVANPGYGCPMPAIGSDLAREAQSVRAEFTAGLRRVVDALSKSRDEVPDERQAAALREIAMLVGAVLLARASDDDMAAAVLEACRA